MNSRIYLDANATTPLDPRVRDAMLPWLDCGNASSPHAEGRAARSAIDRAREQVAALIGSSPREILFTSGATEANALALLGSVRALGARHVFTSAVEHPSVLRTLEALRPGIELTVGPVDSHGRLAPDCDLGPGVELVSVMAANNETGTLQPVRQIAEKARMLGAVVHTDAAQACGKIEVRVEDLGVDLLTLSAHKMHGPKGAGALYARVGIRLLPLFSGGEHERGLRAGTENVSAIVGLGAAAELAGTERVERCRLWAGLRARFLAGLRQALPDVLVNSPEDGLANTVSLTLPAVEGEAVLLGLDLCGIAVATGSACSSGAVEPSYVLRALGHSREQAEQSLRISFHAGTTNKEIDFCVKSLGDVVSRLRALEA